MTTDPAPAGLSDFDFYTLRMIDADPMYEIDENNRHIFDRLDGSRLISQIVGTPIRWKLSDTGRIVLALSERAWRAEAALDSTRTALKGLVDRYTLHGVAAGELWEQARAAMQER